MRILRFVFPVILLVTSCGLLGGEEEYEDATLSQIASGSVVSETETFRLVSPEIVAIEKDYALLRDGNQFQILSGDGLEDTLETLDSDPAFLVKKWGYPYPHLRLQALEVEGLRRPISWILADSDLPTLVEKKTYTTSYFTKMKLADWKENGPPDDIKNEQIWVIGHLERVVEIVDPDDLIDSDSGGEEDEFADTLETPLPAEIVHYFLEADSVKIELEPINENGVNLLLEGISSTGKQVALGGFLTETTGKNTRRETGVYGLLQVSAFEFAGKICLPR